MSGVTGVSGSCGAGGERAKLTKAQQRALQWVSRRGSSVTQTTVELRSDHKVSTVEQLVEKGLVEHRVHHLAYVLYALTSAGWLVLDGVSS